MEVQYKYRIIYKTTCTKGSLKGHYYYGQHRTNNLDDGYRGSGKIIINYLKKYPNDTKFEIICFCNSQEELNQKEYEIIHPHLHNKLCLNIQEGGNGHRITEEELTLSEETKKKMSESRRGEKNGMYGKHHTEEVKEKCRQAHLGIPLSNEHKQKLSKAFSGNNNPMYGRVRKGELVGEKNGMYMKHHTEEAKNKISLATKGENNGMYGKHHTEEARKKMSTNISQEERKRRSERMKAYNQKRKQKYQEQK